MKYKQEIEKNLVCRFSKESSIQIVNFRVTLCKCVCMGARKSKQLKEENKRESESQACCLHLKI